MFRIVFLGYNTLLALLIVAVNTMSIRASLASYNSINTPLSVTRLRRMQSVVIKTCIHSLTQVVNVVIPAAMTIAVHHGPLGQNPQNVMFAFAVLFAWSAMINPIVSTLSISRLYKMCPACDITGTRL